MRAAAVPCLAALLAASFLSTAHAATAPTQKTAVVSNCTSIECDAAFGILPADGATIDSLSCSGSVASPSNSPVAVAWISVPVANGGIFFGAPQITSQAGNVTHFVYNASTNFMLAKGAELSVALNLTGNPTRASLTCTVLLSGGS